jgi:hypothetical protein
MRNKTKHFYSFIVAGIFVIVAAGSAKVNKIHCGAFSKEPSGEERAEGGYVLLNDGNKVYGDKVKWKSGLIVKDQIKIGDEKFRIKDTRGYFINGVYYGRLGNSYAKRIVHGKLNVYYTQEMVTSTTTSSNGMMRTSTRMVCRHYVQIGDDGELNVIANQKDILEYVKDCPKAAEMIDKKDKQIRRSIRKNRNYLNEIFITYNNDCE